MSILPIGALSSAATSAIAPTTSTAATGAANAANATGGPDFGTALGQAIDGLNASQANTDQLAVKAATGDLTDVSDYMVSSTESALQTQLTVAVRNKAVDAFNEIMRMNV